jgi:Putative helix-turn-helix domain
LSSPPPSPDSRFLAVRYVAQEASEFQLPERTVRDFLELRDGGAGEAEIGRRLDLEPGLVHELVRADEAQALAHRIAVGEEPMYPPPKPSEQVVDARLGSLTVPLLVLALVLLVAAVWALVR